MINLCRLHLKTLSLFIVTAAAVIQVTEGGAE
jgi:hypothetical protein